ncbi:MAG TPA: hypothetical protein VGP55_08450 [Chitinophagaceae bacterium]|nr:hypothetical protein [Chitinophagaceae bacterium]
MGRKYYNWLHLFELTKSYDLAYNWFNILKNDNIEIIAYVIMPKHYKSLWVEFIIIQSLLYIGVSQPFFMDNECCENPDRTYFCTSIARHTGIGRKIKMYFTRLTVRQGQVVIKMPGRPFIFCF